MVAGEPSGDQLGGLLLAALKARWPQLSANGIGGPKMIAEGFDAWWPQDRLAIAGFVQVLSHYRALLAIRNGLRDRLLATEAPRRADVFVGIDAPDFNLGIEAQLKPRGMKTVHFVSPSIWAWRGKRIEKIRRATDRVLCLFPFEPAIYERAGIDAAYVGHPLADLIPLEVPRAAARTALAIDAAATVVALLPGSRRAEIHHIAPRILRAAALMRHARPDLVFVLPMAPGARPVIERLHHELAPDVDIRMIEGRAHEALAACDVTLVTSGTATLEAALFKRPMVITYVLHPINWQIISRMQYQPWAGLPNILETEFVVPELLQDRATPERLAEATLAWLDDPARCAALERRFEELHRRLRRNTAQAATDAIEALLAR